MIDFGDTELVLDTLQLVEAYPLPNITSPRYGLVWMIFGVLMYYILPSFQLGFNRVVMYYVYPFTLQLAPTLFGKCSLD